MKLQAKQKVERGTVVMERALAMKIQIFVLAIAEPPLLLFVGIISKKQERIVMEQPLAKHAKH